MTEGILLLATLARQWRPHLIRGQRVELWPQITLRPRRSIRMQFQARSAELHSCSAPADALRSI